MKKLIILTLFIGCMPATDKIIKSSEQVDYRQMIENYLKTKVIAPTLVFNNDGRNEFNLLNHTITWKVVENGVEITIDGTTISTTDKVTLNAVWGSEKDSVNFANFVDQVKIYENDSLIGFVLTGAPCSGLGCSVNYQIIYDLKTKGQSYFGRFSTGFEFELYHFNSDRRLDYLSKTFFGRNAQGVDTTEFVLYSQTEDGEFAEFATAQQEKYWFRHTYTEFQENLDNESFVENWLEKIIK